MALLGLPLAPVLDDLLYRVAPEDQLASYEVMEAGITRWSCIGPIDRSCDVRGGLTALAARFPDIANAFDNLHMLHDMVNDILATEWMTDAKKREQITRACVAGPADAHRGEKPGSRLRTGCDHRFFAGMPGMGIMKGMTPELMWMEGMGWMSMQDCHHCSMPLWTKEECVAKSDGHRRRLGDARLLCALCAGHVGGDQAGPFSSFRRKIRMNCSSSSRTSRET